MVIVPISNDGRLIFAFISGCNHSGKCLCDGNDEQDIYNSEKVSHITVLLFFIKYFHLINMEEMKNISQIAVSVCNRERFNKIV